MTTNHSDSNESSLRDGVQVPGEGDAAFDQEREDYRTGPKLDPGGVERLVGLGHGNSEAPTWRGWVVGLISIALIAAITPHIEFYLFSTSITSNLITPGPLITLFLFGSIQMLIYSMSGRMALTRQDLTLIASMCMVSVAIPGYGFMVYVVGQMAGATAYAPKDESWNELIYPYLKEWMIPRDPPVDSGQAMPVDWFMNGLPVGEKVPFGPWLLPYMYWAFMTLCIFGLMYSICAVLRRQWSDRERLPFPLVQVPLEMVEGLPGVPDRKKPFLADRTAMIGMAIPSLIHSWNSISSYVHKWPVIPLSFSNLHTQYLTEPPWNAFGPISVFIYPAVIGLTYLISLEVSFSLWFFYVVLKICAFIAVQFGLGTSHGDFMSVGGHKGFLIDQGGGALIAMVLFGLWMSRSNLAATFLRAIGFREDDGEEGDGISARGALVLFIICFTGAIVWLMSAGVGLGVAMLTIVSMLIIMTGFTRLACEGGLFYIQSDISPSQILDVAVTPMNLGPQAIVPLGMWSRVFVFDWGRNYPMPAIMHALKFGSDTKTRLKPLILGTMAAILIALSVGFWAFMNTAYHNEGGARTLEGGNSWTIGVAQTDFKRSATKVFQILSYERRHDKEFAIRAVGVGANAEEVEKLRLEVDEKRKTGGRKQLHDVIVEHNLLTQEQTDAILEEPIVPESEMPPVSLYDWKRIMWLSIGAVLMVAFMLIRTRIFWWPHPIGYVTWMHASPMNKLWFSILLGWAFKWAITKYGGFKIYTQLRRFFIGLVVGEFVISGVWLAVAAAKGMIRAYPIQIN